MSNNFAVSALTNAPGTSGTSFTVTTGTGSRFVAGKATVGPSSGDWTPANAEVVTITDVATDTLTVTRAQESSTAMALAVGFKIVQGVTAGMYDALVTATNSAVIPRNYVTATTTYTASVGDFVLADATSAGFTVTLPSNPATGSLVTVRKTDSGANVVTVVPVGGGTIDGDANATIVQQWAGAVFEHQGSNVWHVMTAAGAQQGPAGNAATVTLGTVSTLAPGSSVTVTNSGSSSAAVLNFGIPQGLAGASGVQPQFAAGVLGSWYECQAVPGANAAGVSTALGTAIVGTPFIVPENMTIDALGCFISAGVAGSLVRLGLLTPRPSNPFRVTLSSVYADLLVDAGTVDASTSGAKTVTLGTPINLTAGQVICGIGAAQGSAAPTIFLSTNISMQTGPWGAHADSIGGGPRISVTATGVTGAFGSTFTPTAWPGNAGRGGVVYFRRSA